MHKQNISYIEKWLGQGLLLTTEETSIEWVFWEAGGIITRKNWPKYLTPAWMTVKVFLSSKRKQKLQTKDLITS